MELLNAGKSILSTFLRTPLARWSPQASSELPLILARCAKSQQLSYAFRLRLPEVVNRPFLRSEYGGRAVTPHLRSGTLVVLESSTYPGTTDGELREVLEAGSGMRAGQDFHLAYSPEREDPGNPRCRLGQIPKVAGGLEKATALYSRAVETLRVASLLKTSFAASTSPCSTNLR